MIRYWLAGLLLGLLAMVETTTYSVQRQ